MKSPPPRQIWIGNHRREEDWHIPAHAHMHNELIVVLGGHEDVTVNGETFRAAAGDVLFFRPRVVHEERSDAADPLQSCFIGFYWPDDLANCPLRSTDTEGRLRQLCAWAVELRDATHPDAVIARESFLRAAVREFIRIAHHTEPTLATAVRQYVQQHLSRPLTLDQLARHAGMSKFHFIRRYRQQTGRSPMADVRLIRVQQARDLLLSTGQPIKAVAPQVGLGSELALYRLFRKHLHLTPGQLRRAVRR
jgi:AraC-like DNA-binding protein